MTEKINVQLEFTPNPDTLKYLVNRSLLARGSKNYTDSAQAKDQSDLAAELFSLPDVKGVMIGTNFVTVSLTDQKNLSSLNQKAIETIKNFLESGKAVFHPKAFENEPTENQNTSEIEQKIIKILEEKIRPAVAMDGGDIIFEKFEDGLVFIKMQGACSGCPSSLMTLKMGVESCLKEAIPEIEEVVPV